MTGKARGKEEEEEEEDEEAQGCNLGNKVEFVLGPHKKKVHRVKHF